MPIIRLGSPRAALAMTCSTKNQHQKIYRQDNNPSNNSAEVAMRSLLGIAFFIISISLFADNATRFTCVGDAGRLYVEITAQSGLVVNFNFFDNQSVYLASAISVEALRYEIKVFRPDSATSGSNLGTSTISEIHFSLPAHRQVRRVQTGGYYIPSFTYYPAEFSLGLNFTLSNNSTQKAQLKCEGY